MAYTEAELYLASELEQLKLHEMLSCFISSESLFVFQSDVFQCHRMVGLEVAFFSGMVVCLLGCSSVCEIDGGWSHTGPLQVLPSWMKSIASTMLWKNSGVLPFTFFFCCFESFVFVFWLWEEPNHKPTALSWWSQCGCYASWWIQFTCCWWMPLNMHVTISVVQTAPQYCFGFCFLCSLGFGFIDSSSRLFCELGRLYRRGL